MSQPIEITRTEYSAAALRALAGKSDDGAMVRRLLAMALVLEGHSREEAATLNGCYDWPGRGAAGKFLVDGTP